MKKFFGKNKAKFGKNFRFVIHPLTILFAIFSIFVGQFWVVITYFLCLVIHEFSHQIVAKKLGYRCQKIVLYPTGALLFGEADQFAFADEIAISIAGPLSNVILIILCVFCWWIFPETYNYTMDFVVANLSLAMFNLLPIFPLDGGRVMLAILSKHAARKTATKICKHISLVFSILLMVAFVISCFFNINFSLGIMAVVVFATTIFEDKNATYLRVAKSANKRKRLKVGLKRVTLMFDCNLPLFRVLSKLDNFAYYTILAVDSTATTNFAVIAQFSEEELENFAITQTSQITLKDLATLLRKQAL